MKNQKIIAVISSVCLVLVLAALSFMAACAKPTPAPPVKPIVLKVACYPIETDMRTKAIQYYADIVKERSKGRVEMKVFPGESLCKSAEEFDMVAARNIDMSATSASTMVGKVPIANFTNIPFHLTMEKVDAFSTRTADIFAKYLAEKNVRYLWAYNHGNGQWFARNRFFKSSADFKGIKMRSAGGLHAKYYQLMGASMVAVTSPEQYMALQLGTVDCTQTSSSSYLSLRLYEVAPYVTVCDHLSCAILVIINKDSWNQLPADLQKIMLDAAPDAQKNAVKLMIEFDGSANKEMERVGSKFYHLTKEERAEFVKAREVLFNEFAATGPDFAAIVNICRELQK